MPAGGKVLADEVISFYGLPSEGREYFFRRVEIYDAGQQPRLVFLSNHLQFGRTTLAAIYKERWKVELFFKALKQWCKIKTFVGTSANAVKTQVWTALIALLLLPFMQDRVAPGSHTDGWLGYLPLESKGYTHHTHQVTFLRGKKKTPSELMPRVHQVVSLLKRWLIGTHQGAVSHKLPTPIWTSSHSAFNRRRSKSRGKLFFRLAQQAVAVDPVTYYGIVHPHSRKSKPQPVGVT